MCCSKRYPTRIFVEGADLEATPPVNKGDEDDFFTSWDKPASKPSTPSSSSAPTSPPVLGRSASANSTHSNGSAPAAPRTISSSSFRSTSSTAPAGGKPGSKLAASRLGSSNSVTGSSTGGTGPKKGKLGGLGAKKAVAPINFDEVEKRAQEEAAQAKKKEEEERKRREEDKARLEAEEKLGMAAVASGATTKSTEVGSKPAVAVVDASVAAAKSKTPQGNTHDLERLGMGFKKLGFGGVPQASASSRSKYVLYNAFHITFLSTGRLLGVW